MVQGQKVWTLGIIATVRKTGFGGLAFVFDEYNRYGTIERKHFWEYPGYTSWTPWKMINMGTQGVVKPDNQVCTLHIYVNKLDIKDGKTAVDGFIQKPAEYRSCVPIACVDVTGSQDWLGA